MNWAAPYQLKRDQYWPEIEHFFSALPPQLLRQGMLLKNNLATFYADTGQFKDILCRSHDHPLLYWHLWLLDDWNYPTNTARDELEQRLFLAMAFAFSAVYTQELILDLGSNFDNRFLFLTQTLSQQADFHLARLFPHASPFWEYQQALWQERAEAILTTTDRRYNTLVVPPTAELPILTPDLRPPPPAPHPLAFTKIPIVAVALKAGREDLLPQLDSMLDRLNLVFQIMREISTLKRDLGQYRLTYPIYRTMQAAGLDPLQPPSPEQLLGALILTGTIETIGQECLSELEVGRAVAASLKLPAFSAYLAGMADWVNEVRELFSIKAKPKDKPVTAQRRPLFVPYVDILPKVIEMAEGYLLSDLTFRESWEIQRRGVLGAAKMTGKAFPMGLIVEILNQHGHNMAMPINEIFDTLQATDWRYYDHPHLPPDADDLGLLLRLYPYSTQPERHREMLQTPLRWLQESLSESGEIPVWLAGGADHRPDYPFLALWGQSCATVEANVLLGLMAFDGPGYRDLIEKSVAQWPQRIISQGLSANRHYTPLYALWTAFELLTATPGVSEAKNPQGGGNEASSIGAVKSGLKPQLDLAAQTLIKRLTIEVKRPYLTPQDAAFLSLACLCLEQRSPKLALASPFKLDWITLLCKSQRYDGSWAAEPLYGTPTRGEFAAWYSSRSVTTAFCYHALKRIVDRR